MMQEADKESLLQLQAYRREKLEAMNGGFDEDDPMELLISYDCHLTRTLPLLRVLVQGLRFLLRQVVEESTTSGLDIASIIPVLPCNKFDPRR